MRARRFPLQLAVTYRPVGQAEWRQGRTANVSASGVLVQTGDDLEINTPLEFRLTLAEEETPPRSQVTGRGHVVRHVVPPECASRGFAVAFDEYTLLSAVLAHV